MNIQLDNAVPVILMAHVACQQLPVPKVVKPVVGALAAILCVLLLVKSFTASA